MNCHDTFNAIGCHARLFSPMEVGRHEVALRENEKDLFTSLPGMQMATFRFCEFPSVVFCRFDPRPDLVDSRQHEPDRIRRGQFDNRNGFRSFWAAGRESNAYSVVNNDKGRPDLDN